MASQEVGLANGPEVVGRKISAAQNVILAFGRTDLPTLKTGTVPPCKEKGDCVRSPLSIVLNKITIEQGVAYPF